MRYYGLAVVFLVAAIGVCFAGKSAKECSWNGTVSALDDNCTKIAAVGGVLLSGTDDINVLYTKFAHVEDIVGCVQVSSTTYRRLDFFARLRSVTCSNTSYPVDFMVANNSALERLGMPVLKVNRLALTFNPKLCITREEATRYTNVQRGASDNITICQGRSGEIKECVSKSNTQDSGLEDGCEIIIGNLFVEGVNNANINQKLQYVKEVNGRIYIRATNLANLTIPLLERVMAAESTEVNTNDPNIFITSNINFTKLALPTVNFMAKNDLAFQSTDASYVMDQQICNALSPFGSVMSNGTVCVSNEERRMSFAVAAIVILTAILYKPD